MEDSEYRVPTPDEIRRASHEVISANTSALTDEELRSLRLAFRTFARGTRTPKLAALFATLAGSADGVQTDREFQAMAVLDDLYEGLDP